MKPTPGRWATLATAALATLGAAAVLWLEAAGGATTALALPYALTPHTHHR